MFEDGPKTLSVASVAAQSKQAFVKVRKNGSMERERERERLSVGSVLQRCVGERGGTGMVLWYYGTVLWWGNLGTVGRCQMLDARC